MSGKKKSTKESKYGDAASRTSARTTAEPQTSRILQWIELKDPELAGVIRDNCMDGALVPGKDSMGVTFMFPEDAKTRKAIVDKAYSEEAEDVIGIVRALIIPDAIKSVADWKARPVGSVDGVLYKVKSASGATVILEGDGGDVKLERADDFRARDQPRESDQRLAVWRLVSGRLPLRGEEYKRPRRVEKVEAPPARPSDRLGRRLCAEKVEADFCLAMERDRARTCNPFLSKVAGLLMFLRKQHPELLASLLPLLDWSPEISFYLLLEPFKTAGDPLIPDNVLFGSSGWNGSVSLDPIVDFKGFLNAETKGSASVRNAVELEREHINRNPGKFTVPKALVAAYVAMLSKNAVGSLTPVLPEDTAKKLGAPHHGKKIWQDELRFVLSAKFMDLYRAPRFDRRDFEKITRCVRDRPGNRYDKAESTLLLIAEDTLKSDVAPNANYGLLVKFINSTAFLYVAAPEDEVGEPLGTENPKDLTLLKLDAFALAHLGRLTISPKTTVSPHVLAEVRAYVDKYGRLPDEFVGILGPQSDSAAK
ncbi:MAG: hypothetical protein KGL39_10975 [Patescibacteria group bacterium]|nr:hypothetical protein [Patescibacteria group bacterium]